MQIERILAEETSDVLERFLTRASSLYVKKLSNNDRDWAQYPNKHQRGVYVPSSERDSDFFPPLAKKDRDGGDEIREVFFRTEWPQEGEARTARLVHYTSKGEETHLTGVPIGAFRGLTPASFLVIGRFETSSDGVLFQCITVDSASDDADALREALEIGPDEISFVRYPVDMAEDSEERAVSFLESALKALRDGTLSSIRTRMPSPYQLAELARQRFTEREGIVRFDPFELEAPGDVVRQLSRVDEWEIFKEFQLQIRSLELVSLLAGDDPRGASVESVVTAAIRDFHKIDALFLSASQQRKARAGSSFEIHIERLLVDGAVPFDKQTIVSSRRPDFVLPSLTLYKSVLREKEDAVVLSAKTTLRERWKQIVTDGINCSLFLMTVDETVSAPAITEMAELDITLVVPESLKVSQTTEYSRHSNVVDFRSFFRDAIRLQRSARWIDLLASSQA